MLARALTDDKSLLSQPKIPAAEKANSVSVADLLRSAHAHNTRRAYVSDVQAFLRSGGEIPATPELIAEYVANSTTTLSIATINRRLVAIGRVHVERGFSNPCTSDLVKSVMRGARRTFGKPQRQAAAILKEDLLSMLATIPPTLKGQRDRALLLLGFAGALRRSELVGIDYGDVERVRQGFIITITRSKVDPTGTGRRIGIPFGRGLVCPVSSVTDWLEAAGIRQGPIFRPVDRHGFVNPSRLSGAAVCTVVKERARGAGLDCCRYSGHSLRAGLATSAALMGVAAWKIKAQTGHTSNVSLERYIREGDLFVNNAAVRSSERTERN